MFSCAAGMFTFFSFLSPFPTFRSKGGYRAAVGALHCRFVFSVFFFFASRWRPVFVSRSALCHTGFGFRVQGYFVRNILVAPVAGASVAKVSLFVLSSTGSDGDAGLEIQGGDKNKKTGKSFLQRNTKSDVGTSRFGSF